jgi:hypothetical protein
MPNNAIDNSNLLQMCADCGAAGFVPGATYTYDSATGAVVITAAVTLPAGDAISKIKAQLFDKFGGEVRGNTSTATGTITLDGSTLNNSKPFDLKVSIFTTGHIAADGGAYHLQPAGSVSQWDVQKNA